MPRRKRPKLEWTETAERNLELIRAYIAQDSPRNAERFIGRIRKAVKELSRFSHTGELLTEDERGQLREFYVNSYRVIFRVGENTIRIITIIHGARDFHLGGDTLGDIL